MFDVRYKTKIQVTCDATKGDTIARAGVHYEAYEQNLAIKVFIQESEHSDSITS